MSIKLFLTKFEAHKKTQKILLYKLPKQYII